MRLQDWLLTLGLVLIAAWLFSEIRAGLFRRRR